jgi:hypothetical protein
MKAQTTIRKEYNAIKKWRDVGGRPDDDDLIAYGIEQALGWVLRDDLARPFLLLKGQSS